MRITTHDHRVPTGALLRACGLSRPPNLGQGCYAHISGGGPIPSLPPKATAEPYILPQGGRSFSHFYHKTVCNKSCLYHILGGKVTLSLPSQTEIMPRALNPCSLGQALTTLSTALGCTRRPDSHVLYETPKVASRLWFPVSQGGTPRALCEPRAQN